MNRNVTVAIVGAGSSYTPELIDGFLDLDPEQLPVARFNLFDPNAEADSSFSRRISPKARY